ncbi:MAG: response regulator [Cyanobacteria bacterium J06592_8]
MTTTIECAHLKRLTTELEQLSAAGKSGILTLNSHIEEAKLYFSQGQLLYATSHIHRLRRWSRAVEQCCSDITVKLPPSLKTSLWEYQLLYQAVRHQEVSVTEARGVIRRVFGEVLFSMSRQIDFNFQWENHHLLQSGFPKKLTCSLSEMKKVVQQVAQMQTQWQMANLGNLDPNLALILTQPTPNDFSGLARYLNGEWTLWDISLQIQKPIVSIARAFIPLIKKGLLQLQMLPDVSIPVHSDFTVPTNSNSDKLSSRQLPLIACIDDSAVVGESLKKILTPVGCHVLSILNPVKGLTQIAEHKPDLIFLDLMMPKANGYIVCKFLHNAPIFKNTPVIILTSRNTIVDRNYAKYAGAADFLNKPPDPRKTLQVVRKHLAHQFPILKTYYLSERKNQPIYTPENFSDQLAVNY